MSLKDILNQDLKTALLGGDKHTVETIKSIKSAILYVELSKGKRDEGLNDQEIIEVMRKESKKRQESIDLYLKAGDSTRADKESFEKKVIEQYLPAQMTEEQIAEIIAESIKKLNASGMGDMGKVIKGVKEVTGNDADGGTIARLTKELLEMKPE